MKRKELFLGISTGLKTRKRKSGSKNGCLSGPIGKNRLFEVVGRDVGFGSPNRDRPDEIGTVGKYAENVHRIAESTSRSPSSSVDRQHAAVR